MRQRGNEPDSLTASSSFLNRPQEARLARQIRRRRGALAHDQLHRKLDLLDPPRCANRLEQALARDRSGAIVLGCAGMADLAEKLSRKFDVPVIDGVAAALKQAEALAGLKLRTSRRGSYASPGVKDYTGLLQPFAPRT